MKKTYLRSGAALLCAATLAACGGGGGGGNIPLIVRVVGLTEGSIKLKNNGGDELTTGNAPSGVSFSQAMADDKTYNVTISQESVSAKCTVSNGSGKINWYNRTVDVVCLPYERTLGGSISGLTGRGLTLANGASSLNVEAGATSFVFGEKVFQGLTYAVAVLRQPDGQSCAVVPATASGTVGAVNITNVTVTCK
ncbi:hypothetical protein [Pseudoduganella violacea]|uniref:Lipoprotein n=1 Tax=Pseudoduganella violacea TaxID=1715466 RepID=A0A7W5BCJ9_9BURK|nr:hypothetical protein [Pseudoduganella violacea]MBB3119835.1 hypothetical protein [Pseudoduganella violacea]